MEVVNKLEGTAYYKEGYAVKKYLDKFQTLIADTNYTNSYTIVIQFCCCLWAAI